MSSIDMLKLSGRFLDQPMLVSKVSKQVPKVLVGGAAILGARSVIGAPDEKRKKALIKNLCVLSFTIASSLIAIRGLKINGKTLIKGLIETPEVSVIANNIKIYTEKLLKNQSISKKTIKILNKAQSKILNLNELKFLKQNLGKTDAGKKLLQQILPDSANLKASEIFGEIKKLSLLGVIPVIGGVTGGVLGEKLVGENWKKKLPNKFKEGFYQFFANIFLCNIGAGVALALMEKANVHSKTTRAAGMAAGILLVGVIGGSFISNFIAKNFLNPIVSDGPLKYSKKLFSGQLNNGRGVTIKDLNSERRPELVDIMLHSDDFATVGVLSGFKWIEPLLPVLYSISGYRAGIGYRNGNAHNKGFENRHSRNFHNNMHKINYDQKIYRGNPFVKFESFETELKRGNKCYSTISR